MKLLCVLLFCLSAAAALRLGYKHGMRYSYNYDGWIIHGIAEAFEEDLALRIRAKAHLDYLTDGFVRMTLARVKLNKVVNKLLYNDRVDTHFEEGQSLDDVKDRLKQCLELPVKFRFKKCGVEKKLIAESIAPEWCVNVQRAVINHLYLPIKNNNEDYQIRLNEVTVLGACQTAYAIAAKNPYYKIKRAIDLTKCTLRPHVLQLSLPNTDAFVQPRAGRATAKELPNFVRSAAYMHYDLQGDKTEGFIIRQVVSENVEELTLNGDKYQAGKAVGAHARQTLTLCGKEKPIPSTAKTIKNPTTRMGLLFVFDKDKSDIESTTGQTNLLRKIRAQIDKIKQHLQSGNIKAETAMEYTRIVSLLRHCIVKTLREVAKDIMACTNVDVRHLLIDAMAQTGTEAAAVVLKECIDGGKVAKELDRIAHGVGWVRGLDTAFMRKVLDICQHQAVVADLKAHRTCWLSFGTLVNRLTVKMRRNPWMARLIKVILFRQTIAKTLREAIQNSKEKEEDLITYLKAAGNAGYISRDLFKVVSTIITDILTPIHVRIQAIWSLRHVARVYPIPVRRVLLPILANPLGDPEERGSCFKILFHNDPSFVTCQMMAGVLAREAAGHGPRSNQFVSFVVSDLRTSIQYDKIDAVKASRARLLLRVVARGKTFDVFAYSKGINIPIDAGNGIGMELRLNKINGPQSFIPRHLHTKMKVNMPGISADFLELAVRNQGVHDILMQFLGPKASQQKRSLDILKYIFGAEHEQKHEEVRKRIGYQKKLPPRVETYIKLFGSEVYFGRLVEADLRAIIQDALFGAKTTTAGCTFTAEDVKCDLPFTRAHMVSEKRYMIPTLAGIPLKFSSKLAAVVKGRLGAEVTGVPKLITSNFEKIEAKIAVKPTTSIYMHNKVGVWLPVCETAVIVKHQAFSEQNMDFILTVKQNGYKLDVPINAPEQKLWIVRPSATAVMAKELVPGDRQWFDIDLHLRRRGFINVPQYCYGKDYVNLMLCEQGRIVDAEYLRLQRLQTFPFFWMNQRDIRIKTDEVNPATKFTATYNIMQNTDTTYEGMGTLTFVGKTKNMEATMHPKCDKKAFTCQTKWTWKHKQCPNTCRANTTISYSERDKLVVATKYGGDKEMNNEILLENEGKTMRIINTWNKLPEDFAEYLRLKRPELISFLHHYFGIKGVVGTEKRCEVVLKLFDKFLTDIFVNTTNMQLRRINHELPTPLENFRVSSRSEMMKRFYGACLVKGANHIETTDKIVIKEKFPGKCPFVLAEDAREASAQWRILFRKAEGDRQILIAEITVNTEVNKIEFGQDMTVKVNGKLRHIEPGVKNPVPGGNITKVNNKLYFQANLGFQCLFDGITTAILVSPWYHNRVRGICGNNDGEQWTDFGTRRATYLPEKMTKEFLREWVVEGTDCKDKQCKMKAKHRLLTKDVPAGKMCFTIGRFLRCMDQCKAVDKHVIQNVAYHCFDANDPLVRRIQAGEAIALETKSVDKLGPVEEHIKCQCNCQ